MKKNMRQNSLDRYVDMIESGELKGRQAEVIEVLRKTANISAQHICKLINRTNDAYGLGVLDTNPNLVNARLGELREKKFVATSTDPSECKYAVGKVYKHSLVVL